MPDTSSKSRLSVLIPALTFLAGLALGWAVVAVSQSDDPDDSPEASAEASESPTSAPAEGDIVVTVPAACEQSAANLREATSLLRESVGQVRDFNPDQIVDTLNRLEEIDEETRPLIDECEGVSVTQSPSESPSPSE